MRRLLAVCALAVGLSANAAVPSSQRDALIAFYQSTGGPNWTNSTGWLGAPGTECDWFGIHCDAENANVTGIELYANNLRGPLPAALRNLTKLQYLQVWQNQLDGALPPELAELPELLGLYADDNDLEGELPRAFGAMPKLRILDLDGNRLSGPIPAELGNIATLEEIGLSNNAFTGPIPGELSKLTNLTFLELAVNQLSGPIPPSLGTLTKLTWLNLSVNQLTGTIPPQLGNLAALEYFGLVVNDVEGPIPAELGNLKSLQSLVLDRNRLSGPIPPSLGNLSALRELILDSNRLTGQLPDALFNLTNLERLHVGDNLLTGTLSPRIAELKKLESFSVWGNMFHGTIPIELTTLASLRSLELSANDFTGPLPPELSRLTNLQYFYAYDNQFSGPLPPQLGTLSKLIVLIVYDNELEGTIPPELGQLSKLEILNLDRNHFTGMVPDSLRDLKALKQFTIAGNQLSGTIPSWLGELTELTDFFAGGNRFTGVIPASVAHLTKLQYFDVTGNQLTGSLPDFTKLGALVYFYAEYNELSGPIPESVGALANLGTFAVAFNNLSGPLPKGIGNWSKVEYLSLSNNSLEGRIPAEIGALTNAYAVSLWGNRFNGAIPKEIGLLASVQYLDLSFNALHGPIPSEIRNLTTLADRGSDFSYNALFTNDAATRAFVNSKQYDQDFEATQTLTPANVRVTQVTDRSVTLQWTPIPYHYDDGGYQVIASTANGSQAPLVTTSGKNLETVTVRNLQASATYSFTVTTVTYPHDPQKNLNVSDPSAPVSATTGPRIVAPPEVVLSEAPEGMVVVDGQNAVDDQFTVTNFGDLPTTLTLERGGDFFTFEPATFALAGGASQVVKLHANAQQPAGTYYGHVVIRGDGAADDLIAYVVLLSAARPAGSVVAVALEGTIEVAGAPGSDSVGEARFRNTGTARLTGIVLSDQPWVIPATEPVTIDPGSTGGVTFRVVRAKRPEGSEGALVANLSLVYLDGNSSADAILSALATSSSISVTKVTVVDTTKPPVTTGTMPPLGAGELPLIIPGLTNRGNLRSDISLVNSSAGRVLDNLKLYFTSGSSTSIASLQPLAAPQAMNLVNVIGNVYGNGIGNENGIGTMHVRSGQPQNVAVEAKATLVTDAGTLGGTLPVFRLDRATASGGTLYLTGLARPADLILQETGGTATNAHVAFLDANGQVVDERTRTLNAGELVELRDAVPANAVTAVVSNNGGGALLAYARITDAASGDTWSVVDWSAFYRYERTAAVRVPFADGFSGGSSKRRSARTFATTPRAATDVTLFNPTSSETRARLQILESNGRTIERDLTIAPRTTIVLRNAAAGAQTPTAQLVITPTRGELVATARSSLANKGTAIPVLAATAGLRLGQSQGFTGLDDSTSTTVANGTPATFRTGYGLVETGGGSARVRATIIVDEAHALVSAFTSRTFDLAPRQQLYLSEVLRSFAGATRDSVYGDLHDLTLELEMIGGDGAVVPFIIETDNGTGDSVLRVQ
jgi:Leucine-rich repeat (LRR) protein